MKEDDDFSWALTDRWSALTLSKGYTSLPNVLIKNRKKLGYSPTEFYILAVIMSYQWHNKKMPFPSLTELSKVTDLSERQISRITGRLESLRLLCKNRRFGTSNVYDLEFLDGTLRELVETDLSSNGSK